MSLKTPAPKKSPFKVIGPLSGRAWKEVTSATESSDEGVKPNDFRDFLVDFINSPNLLVLVGSGTSLGKAVGGPSMSKLWDAVSSIDGFQETVKAVQQPLTEKNIEAFLSRCKSASPFLSANQKETVAAFVKMAEDEIYTQCSVFLKNADLDSHKEFLRRLARRSTTKPRLRLFTTNYDRCFEKAAGEIGYVIVDGFSYSKPRTYSANFFNYDFVRRDSRQREAPDYVENVFHLMKLHGSVDWHLRDDGAIVQTRQPTRPCLIYPANTKFELSYTQPYLEMMGQFLAALREKNSALLVLGFGFNDNHLTQPIKAAVESNTGLRVVVVDPFCEVRSGDAGTFQQYLQRHIEANDDRITLVNADFIQFVNSIPNLARVTQEEQLANIVKTISNK